MTTIVYNHKTQELGSDSLVTCDGICSLSKFKKIRRIHRCWVGFCGSVAGMESIISQMLSEDFLLPNSKLHMPNNAGVQAIVLPDRGRPWALEADGNNIMRKMFISEDFCIGSGAQVALGALYAGASTKTAIAAAINYDTSSGGKIVIKKRGRAWWKRK